jgi:MFS family permease
MFASDIEIFIARFPSWMAGLLPIMLALPLVGKLADKFDRKRLVMTSEFGPRRLLRLSFLQIRYG